MDLLNLIEEQIAIHFSGRINILKSENRQLLGTILIKKGELFFCKYKTWFGKNAFAKHFFDLNLGTEKFSYIVEPEIVDGAERNIFINYNFLFSELNDAISKIKETQGLRPAEELYIVANPEFLSKKEELLSGDEFDLFCLLLVPVLVKDLYKTTRFYEHEMTLNLVYLRKKGAILVMTP